MKKNIVQFIVLFCAILTIKAQDNDNKKSSGAQANNPLANHDCS